jgi:adenylate kinase
MTGIMLLGPPGSGKGTQAARIIASYDIPVISTGNIFRENLSDGTPLGLQAKEYIDAGELVPDDCVIGLVAERLKGADTRNGYLLDGFPRTLVQAEALDALLTKREEKLDKVIYINVPKDVLVNRIAGRLICPVCGRTYHVTGFPPKQEGVCDLDGAALIQRVDDSAATAENRIDVYNEQTKPLVEYYAKAGVLVEMDGTLDADDLQRLIAEFLG